VLLFYLDGGSLLSEKRGSIEKTIEDRSTRSGAGAGNSAGRVELLDWGTVDDASEMARYSMRLLSAGERTDGIEEAGAACGTEEIARCSRAVPVP